jgi:hypothetical protein
MTPEEIKERRDYTLLAVGMTTIVAMNAQYYALGFNVYLSGSVTLLLAGVAGWITWTKKTA